MSTALRRAAASQLLVAIAALVVGAGIAGGALVGFSAEDQHQASTYAGGWLAAPTSLGTPAPSGYGATLTWTPGAHGLADQALVGTDEGTTASCTGAPYSTSFAASLGAATASTTDSRGSSANGHWVCYEIRSTHGSWYAGSDFPVVQVGLVPAGISVDATAAGDTYIDNGDTITLSFNQNVAYTGAATIGVCSFQGGTATTGVILVGDGCGSVNDTPTIGTITGLGVGATRTFPSSAVSVTGSQVVITVGGNTGKGNSSRASVSGTGTFAYTGSGTTIQSSAGSASVCTAANCTWTYSGGF